MADASTLEHAGCRLAWKVTGAGDPVVMIQGVGVHGDGWRPQVEALRHRWSCLTFDNRGAGASQPLGVPRLTVDQMADDVRALMDAQGWSSAHVVGHSLGGLVALVLALRARPRVRSLALLCTFARGRDAGRSARMIWVGTRSRVGTRRMRRHAFLEIVMPPDLLAGADRDQLAADLAPLFGHDLADHPAIEMRQLSAMRGCDVLAELPALADLPTLVVSAEHDPIAPPPLGEAMARAVPGARFVLLRQASHGVPIHGADAVNTLLATHLDRVP
ncbi:MAG: alpha/beta fold hydrolase [Vicinamibacterales bacterium]